MNHNTWGNIPPIPYDPLKEAWELHDLLMSDDAFSYTIGYKRDELHNRMMRLLSSSEFQLMLQKLGPKPAPEPNLFE